MQLAAYFKILRPFNICISILCVLLGGFIMKQLTFHLLPLILVVSGLAGFANIINDIMDYKIDQVNNLDRPIASNMISIKVLLYMLFYY